MTQTTVRPDVVAYDVIGSPVGPLLAVWGRNGLRELSFDGEEAAAGLGSRAKRYPEQLLDVRYQLGEYFAGERTTFDLAVDLNHTTEFMQAVFEATALIPYGETRSYGQVAEAARMPRAARAVGQALNRNPVAIVVPCHRVVAASGALTGFGGGLARKEALLGLEDGKARSAGWAPEAKGKKGNVSPASKS